MTGSPRPAVVDTNIAIAAFRRNQEILQRLSTIQSIVPSTVLGELYYGAYGAVKQAQELTYITTLVATSIIVHCTQETADWYGQIKQTLRQQGTLIPENDMWIAAHALQHRLPVVTRDAHFERVPGLTVEIW